MSIWELEKNDKRKFKIFTPIKTSKSFELEDDGTLLLEGVASDTSLDLQYDIVTEEAITQMKEQAPELNIHGDHEYALFGGVIGSIIEVLDSDDNLLKIKFRISKGFAEQIRDLLNADVKLGLSIGGDVQEFKEIEDPDGFYGWEILAIKLYEISLVALPANWNTFGTVTSTKGVVKAKCLAGACYQVLKNNGVKIMKKNKKNKAEGDGEGEETPNLTEDQVTQMINEAITEAKEDIKNEVVAEVEEELKEIVQETIDSEESSESEGESEGEGKGLSESNDPVAFSEDEKKALKEKIKEEAFAEIIKELGVDREPEATHQPEDDEEEEEVSAEKKKTQSVDDSVKKWAKKREKNSLQAMLLKSAQEN